MTIGLINQSLKYICKAKENIDLFLEDYVSDEKFELLVEALVLLDKSEIILTSGGD